MIEVLFAFTVIIIVICIAFYLTIKLVLDRLQKLEILKKSETTQEAQIFTELFKDDKPAPQIEAEEKDPYIELTDAEQIISLEKDKNNA